MKVMTLIDTHSHLYHEDYTSEIDSIILAAKQDGISHIFLPNIDVDTIEPMLLLADKFPDFCIPLMGLHPTSVDENYLSQLETIENELKKRSYCGIGEIGIDLYWDKTYLTEQQNAFRIQIQWAIDRKLPIVIHVRNSFRETMDVLHEFDTTHLRGVFHSFCGTADEAKEILALDGFYLGINGIVTFKNSDLGNTLHAVPLERIVLETDSPYLTPSPHRGKRNHPSYLKLIANKLSEVYELPLDIIAETTTQNAKNLFRNHF